VSKQFFIGWDVGGWNCDKNRKSRDAIVILDDSHKAVGRPWRGNLREVICTATTALDWLSALFIKCGASYPEHRVPVTMAIDTPLGFSDEFIGLITGQRFAEPDARSPQNHYLFRRTERFLSEHERKPLSAIKDMIGSQATKGMHAIAKFAPHIESCGVWTDGHGFRAIETYPAVCGEAEAVKTRLYDARTLAHPDKNDAHVCALVAHIFANARGLLCEPDATIPAREGWIWFPKDPQNKRPPESITQSKHH
jgi:hypothetical protein